jgi:tetratricopeptide (TPR) repeat protein
MGCGLSVSAREMVQSASECRIINGVSLDYLSDFVQKNGGEQLAGFTCQDVCDAVIKPMTLRSGYRSTTGQSVVQMLESAFDTSPGDVKRANWYVVHAWSALFLDLISSLQMFFSDIRNRSIAPPVLWIDLFCIDQHSSHRSCEEVVATQVLPALRSCSRVLFVPAAWKRSIALQRTWCVFELVQAHMNKFPVFLALAPAQRVIFLRFLEDLASHNEFYDAVGRVRLQQIKCTREDDHHWLIGCLTRSPGVASADECVEGVLRGWLLHQLRQQLASSQAAASSPPIVAKWMILIGELLADSDEKELAASMLEDALPLLQSYFGPQHARTISCSWTLAKLLVKLEKYSESVPLLTHCLEVKKALLGSSNDSVLTLQHTLGSVLVSLREFERAETLFVVSLTSLRQLYGDDDVRTAAAASALADLYRKTGQLAQAAKFYRKIQNFCSLNSLLRLHSYRAEILPTR